MGPDPISLVNTARRDLQTLVNLVSNYERTKDVTILSNIVKLSLSIYDNAINAFLAVKGIRVKDPEHMSQVAHDFIPSEVASADLRDFLIKCLSQTDCNDDYISARIGELGRLVDYVHSVSTHSAIHRGL
ncbi:hypothetical protein [Vulcanisaeta distributa]|uniref:PaREP1 family protein n=1 Tax=Vulcanisaeta distributa (strain DSM 14429 / JCM 11212 / NBRC 100878 / IC-017) TaxID=572478 RepID=E1QUV6_VULDI|nr:hypothetical protein [Vulcanisaeta distributa]ADN49959.1 hypothetical protein Vdis_0561 [Vulcanisaeta distributa DSM 14429]